MLIDFLIAYSVCSTAALIVAGGKAVRGSSSCSCAGSREKLKVRNPEDATGRFYVSYANYNPRTGECSGEVCDRRKKTCLFEFIDATSVEQFEKKVDEAYIRLAQEAEKWDEYHRSMKNKGEKRNQTHKKHPNKHRR